MALGSCGPGRDTGDTIKIGEFASLTGATASFGTASHNGAVMVIDAVNASGGVLGKKVKLITQGRPVEAG